MILSIKLGRSLVRREEGVGYVEEGRPAQAKAKDQRGRSEPGSLLKGGQHNRTGLASL